MKIRITFLILLGISTCYAQTIPRLEDQFNQLHREIARQQAVIDSLQAVMEKLAIEIENLKTAKRPDEHKIKSIMAQVVTQSGKKTAVQRSLVTQQKHLKQVKRKLDKLYSAKIDSLKKQKESATTSAARSAIEKQLLDFTQKRLFVVPDLTAIKFEPELLNRIQFKEGQDSLESRIYLSYLRNAESEIEVQLSRIGNLQQELEEITLLRKKTADFVSEVGDEADFGLIAQGTRGSAKSLESADFSTNGSKNVNSGIQSQLLPLFALLNQLKLTEISVGKQSFALPLDTARAMLSEEQYLELLKKAEKMLRNYQVLVKNKLPKNAR